MLSVHHLPDYGGPYSGSFIPMLVATAIETNRRGGRTTLWLRKALSGREWLPRFDGIADLRWIDDRDGRRAIFEALRHALAVDDSSAVMHTHFSAYDIPAALAALRRPRTAVFWHEHNRPLPGTVAHARNRARYSLLGRTVDGILCVSPEITSDLQARGAPKGTTRTLPNAIDVNRFVPADPADRAVARRELGLHPRDQVVLHFSWDWNRKGGDVLLEAAASTERSDLTWLTVPGPPAGVELPARATTLAPRDDVERLYAAADVFVSCSRSEGMPYAMLEALACGLPVVATDLPGQRPLLKGLPGARLIPLERDRVVTAVAELTTLGPEALAAHSLAARERVTNEYSLDRWARTLVDDYENAVHA